MIYKFIIPPGDLRVISSEMRGEGEEWKVEAAGCLAVVRADSLEDARSTLRAYCEAMGHLVWGDAADVTPLDGNGPAVLAYAEV